MDAPHPDPANPEWANAVRGAVLSMPAAKALGFTFGGLAPGSAELLLTVRPEHTQHDGYAAGSVLGALADFAGGSAAGTLLPPGWVTLTSGYTLSIVAPAVGTTLVARGRVRHAGRGSTVSAADIFAVPHSGGAETLCATALVTMRNLELRPRG